MRKPVFFILLMIFSALNAQTKKTPLTSAKIGSKPVAKATAKAILPKLNPDLAKINDSIPALIPQKKDGKIGYINQRGKVMIRHQFSNAAFFYEDCNLLNSPNEKLRKFGTNKYASVSADGVDYRIDIAGKRVYIFKKADLGKCPSAYKEQLYHSYVKSGFYGVIEDATFENEADYRQYKVYPQYDYLHIMEGDDLNNPMIVASYQNRFGVIDKNNKVIIPFEYADIKRNFSWKIARMFEVTKDNKNYYFVDVNNHSF